MRLAHGTGGWKVQDGEAASARAFWLYHPMVEAAVAGEPAGSDPSFYQKLTGKITNLLLW